MCDISANSWNDGVTRCVSVWMGLLYTVWYCALTMWIGTVAWEFVSKVFFLYLVIFMACTWWNWASGMPIGKNFWNCLPTPHCLSTTVLLAAGIERMSSWFGTSLWILAHQPRHPGHWISYLENYLLYHLIRFSRLKIFKWLIGAHFHRMSEPSQTKRRRSCRQLWGSTLRTCRLYWRPPPSF